MLSRIACVSLLLLLLSSQSTAAQVVECDLAVGSYGSVGTCIIADASVTPRAGPRVLLAALWPQDTARIIMTSRPSDPPPWRGVLLLGDRRVTFEIDRSPDRARDGLIMRNAWSWAGVYEWRELRAASGATLGSAVLSFGLTDYVQAGSEDVVILETVLTRVDELKAWDRGDDRNCANDLPGQSGLFCLLTAAVEARPGRSEQWTAMNRRDHVLRLDRVDHRREDVTRRIDEASRIIEARASKIYRSFESSEALESWLPPRGMTGKILGLAFREGGGYRMRLTYNEPGQSGGKTSENSDEVEVRFLKLLANRRIEQVVKFDSEKPEFAGSMKMTWSFAAVAQGTQVTVRCENVPEGIRPEDHEAGLTSTLENLAKFTE